METLKIKARSFENHEIVTNFVKLPPLFAGMPEETVICERSASMSLCARVYNRIIFWQSHFAATGRLVQPLDSLLETALETSGQRPAIKGGPHQ
jgi:hypothetical protein